jgi:NADH dehydrogenase (ubiquinone) 1 alpha/beta subcomplex 1, acyl-carrier protein
MFRALSRRVGSVACQRAAARTALVMMPRAAARFGGSAADGPSHDREQRQGAYLLDKTDVLQRVLEVVKNFEKVDASKVTAESNFINDLGLDSLDVVEVVMALEQEFVLDIPDHDAEKLQSIPEAVEYLSQHPQAK